MFRNTKYRYLVGKIFDLKVSNIQYLDLNLIWYLTSKYQIKYQIFFYIKMADNPENMEYWQCVNYRICGKNWVGSDNLCQSCSTPENSVAPSDSISENTGKRLKSSVWEHFTISELDPKKAICKHCPPHRNTFAYSNGGTKNLNNHINSQHY